MNSLLTLFERQQGLRNTLNYDFALTRLCVAKEDSWRGITPSNVSLDYNPEPPIFSAKFASCRNYKHILAIANEDGKIALQDTSKRNYDYEEKALEGQQCHYNAVFDIEWSPGQMKFVSASGDHTARLWEIVEAGIRQCRTFSGHTRSVKTAAFRKNDPAVFSTGGRDGAILIWDTRAVLNMDLGTTRADNCIYSGHGPSTPVSNRKRIVRTTPKLRPTTITSSITGLVFQDDNTLVSCGAGDGVIKIWDLRRNYSCFKREPLPKYSLPYAGTSTYKGFTNLLCDDSGNRLYANCMDNTIYCYNLASYSSKPIERYVGLRNSTFYIKSCLSPDGQYLVSGSSDEKAYIWNINNPIPLVALNGHTVEVTCVAWSSSNDMPLVTCSDDARHKIWRIGPEKIEEDEKINYRGNAEFFVEYKKNILETKVIGSLNNKLYLQSLDSTPRSLKRIVEQNEKTPTTIEKVSSKRSYSDMVDENYSGEEMYGTELKRPHIETRGRRLFSPSTSGTNSYSEPSTSSMCMNLSTKLDTILEDQNNMEIDPPENSHILNNENNQENNITNGSSKGSLNNYSSIKSPLSERGDFNISSPSTSAFTRQSLQNSMIFSPTSNLPNYVLDGEAPHLGIMSPKRKNKEKIDWLTKIRKQKIMSSRNFTNLSDKLASNNCSENVQTTNLDENLNSNHGNSSKMLQQETTSADYPNSPKSTFCGTPKRRLSRTGSHVNDSIHSRTTPTTSNRRNSETTILKFFSIAHSSHSSSINNIENQNSDLNTATSASATVVSTCN